MQTVLSPKAGVIEMDLSPKMGVIDTDRFDGVLGQPPITVQDSSPKMGLIEIVMSPKMGVTLTA